MLDIWKERNKTRDVGEDLAEIWQETTTLTVFEDSAEIRTEGKGETNDDFGVFRQNL